MFIKFPLCDQEHFVQIKNVFFFRMPSHDFSKMKQTHEKKSESHTGDCHLTHGAFFFTPKLNWYGTNGNEIN